MDNVRGYVLRNAKYGEGKGIRLFPSSVKQTAVACLSADRWKG